MDEKILREIHQTVQAANGGNWIPFAVLASCFGLIIVLLIYIYNMHLKQSSERHKTNEDAIKVLSDNNIRLDKIIERHEVTLENHTKEIDSLKAS